MLGPNEDQVQQVRFLNRVITWEHGGLTWEPDPRHVELIVRQLGLENAKPLKVPGVKEETRRTKKEMEADIAGIQHIHVTDDQGNAIGWSSEFIEYRSKLLRNEAKVDWSPEFLEFRRELLARRAFVPANDNDETNTDDVKVDGKTLMEQCGWTNRGSDKWSIETLCDGELPKCPYGEISRRDVTDTDTGETINKVRIVPGMKKYRICHSIDKPRRVEVVMTVGHDKNKEQCWEDQAMPPTDASRYRALAARLNFLAIDRPDVLYTAKECSRHMSAPINRDWEALKRAARYLLSCPRVVHLYAWQDMPSSRTLYSDSDWAGCRETRKSTSGACFLHGSHMIN